MKTDRTLIVNVMETLERLWQFLKAVDESNAILDGSYSENFEYSKLTIQVADLIGKLREELAKSPEV